MRHRKEFYFNLTDRCINDCVFCVAKGKVVSPDIRNQDFIRICKNENIYQNEITLSGGEPTVVPDFLDILKTASATGSDITILTNGRLFANDEFTQKVFRIDNLRHLIVSLHGTEATHDAITRTSGSFLQTLKGAINIGTLKPGGCKLAVKTVLCKMNIAELGILTRTIISDIPNVDELILSSLKVSERAFEHINDLAFPLREAEPHVSAFLEQCETNSISVELDHFPACVIGVDNYRRSRLLKPKGVSYSDYEQIYFDGDTIRDPNTRIVFSSNIAGHLRQECVICAHFSSCRGIERSYAKLMGDDDLDPLRYVDERLLGGSR